MFDFVAQYSDFLVLVSIAMKTLEDLFEIVESSHSPIDESMSRKKYQTQCSWQTNLVFYFLFVIVKRRKTCTWSIFYASSHVLIVGLF